MKDLWRRYGQAFTTFALLFVSFNLLSIDLKGERGYWITTRVVIALSEPPLRALAALGRGARAAWSRYLFLVAVERENEDLRRRIGALEAKTIETHELSLENERLHALLQFRSDRTPEGIPARIIGEGQEEPFRSLLLIDRGKADGVDREMAVVATGGIVGQVLRAADHMAHVVVLTDFNLSIPAVVERSRARGIVEGRGAGVCQLANLARTEDVVPGDLVVTSGLGGIFPPGLPLGVVNQVGRRPYGVFQTAYLRPSVDLEKVEEVLVVPAAPEAPRK